MIKMKAEKRFRLAKVNGYRWLDAGDEYEVPTETSAAYHEKSGRGKRVKQPVKTTKQETK